MKWKLFAQGEGLMNSLGGFVANTTIDHHVVTTKATKKDQQDTMLTSSTSAIASTSSGWSAFWKYMDFKNGVIVNWNGEVSKARQAFI